MEQRTTEWYQARLGKATASAIADIVDRNKNGTEKAGRKNYRAQLVVERLTGIPPESFTSGPMQWGIDNEDGAVAAYELETGLDVDPVGFVDHPSIFMSGASPDGLVGVDGQIEVKCPNTATHIEYLLAGVAPKKYLPQMQWQMACTGRAWCDFISYDPRMPINKQLFIVRVNRDDSYIESLEFEVTAFLKEVDDLVERLQS